MFTDAEIALSQLTEAADFRLVRDAQVRFAGKVPTPLEARVVPAARAEHLSAALTQGGIAAVIVPADLADQVPDRLGLGIAAAPQEAVARIQEYLATLEGFQWQHFPSRISAQAQIADSAHIAPQDVEIGPGCVIGPHATILPRTLIGDGCRIGPGTVVGADAFDQMPGAVPRRLMVQSGGVRLEAGVTICANCSISRATFGGFARIGTGTLIDANVYIAHDAAIGENVTICSNASLSGRVTLGDGSYIGPQAAISNGLTVGKGATVSIGSVVTRSVPDHTRVTGNFALPHADWLSLMRAHRSE